MSPRLRTLLFALAASALAVWVGITLANEEHFIAMVSAGAAVWIVLSWTRGPFAEAWLLGFLFFGYVVGNRGFAQLAPVPGVPLFFGELGLAVVLALMVLRGALRRESPVRRDWLNGLLLLWIALGCGRIAWDVRAHGFMALRDFAMVYYALYFYAVQALARHAPSRAVLRGALRAAFAVLPVTGVLATLFPEFFLNNLLADGVPLVFYKGDLLATFLFAGFIVLLPTGATRARVDWWRWLAAIVSLVLGLVALSRASMLGLAVALGWLAWSGRWRPTRVLATVCAAGLLMVTVYSLLQKKDFTQTRAYAIYEAATSITDFAGDRNRQSDVSAEKGDNNRFRLIWWRNVAEETLTTSPLLGLGFGADLTRGFLLDYYPTGETDFTTRSPHNVFMTTLGRMGLVGVTVLMAVYWVQGRSTAHVARRVQRAELPEDVMTLQAATWVVMVSACFGVVLEGPMGAIPCWILLGLAHQAANGATSDAA